MMETSWFTQSDGQAVFLRKWIDPHTKPRAVLQLAHGMAEHSGRYKELATYLAANGIIVYANDHRGHGQTGERMGIMGFFAEANGFERAVSDLYEISEKIKQDHPNLPFFILGHSMGSFLVRRLIQHQPHICNGVILSGTSASKGLIGKLGLMLAKFEIRRLGARAESPLMNQLSFGQYQKGLPTSESWLSRDQQAVNAYFNDPHCGFISTTQFYYDLLYGLDKIHQRAEMTKVNRSVPILLISGSADPVGSFSKGVDKVRKSYLSHGVVSVDLHLYQDGRHEMFFETNRQQVFENLLTWLNEKI
ncbi:alpha/beta hydrolase [Amphibacillus xylanus]|uniref:Putative lipase n=1 Tax=Amphibacillus xylanus (strain ATCC 51415 / DSM 6626 / JCM 7361 / LMG 17667 / NBRC 15112 / Ep01) TaxID=698758 RepID=K0IZV3_AMPXN|nr:alpha/beta hydrolase [Amphibacillus xylanus]BAM48095.1 putative lipase [Amphibacillus xylanus NBRC 15112]